MLTRNIDFKNFKIKKNTQKVKKKLKKILQENNEVIKSLRKTYKHSYNKKLINKFNQMERFHQLGTTGPSWL